MTQLQTSSLVAATPGSAATFLRRALMLDAVATAATGLLMAAGAGPLSPLLGLPAPLMLYAGLSLLPFAGLVAWAGTRSEIPRNLAVAIVAINVLWTLGSVALLGLVSPNTLGVAFVVGQAVAVAGFAALQAIGLRRGAL